MAAWAPGSLRLLADDLTGALDSAAAFGVGVPVGLDRPPAPSSTAVDPAPAHPVAVVATATRDVPVEILPAVLGPLAAWLAEAALAFKKVDSLLRGNTFAEVAWLARAGGFQRVVFAPALPAQGRYTVQGRACLQRAGEACDADRVEPGPSLAERLLAADAARHPGAPALVWEVPEVREQRDLDRVAAAMGWPRGAQGPGALRPEAGTGAARGADLKTLWCGSAGLAQALAERRLDGLPGPASPLPSTRAALPSPAAILADMPRSTLPAAGRPVWAVGASHHPVTRRQWQRARECWPAQAAALPAVQPPLHLHLQHGEGDGFEAALAALRLPASAVRLALLDLSAHRPVLPAEAGVLLARQAAALTALPAPAALLVLGGDTLRALFLASGAQSLVSGVPLQPGWGRARWSGGTWDGLAVDARSGAFGGEDDLCHALARVGLPLTEA